MCRRSQTHEEPTMIQPTEHLRRRNQLLSSLPAGSAVVVVSADLQPRGNGTEAAFSQNSDFLYLTGFNEPESWLILSNLEVPATSKNNHVSTLFCQPKDKLAEIWNGRRLGEENASGALLVDQAFTSDTLQKSLPDLLNNHSQVYFLLGTDSKKEQVLMEAIQVLRKAPKQSRIPPSSIVDLAPVLHELRLLKSEVELEVMQAAADISCRAHARAMRFIKPGVYEYQLEAEIQHEFGMAGARSPAYSTIVGAGENACILHYTDNKDEVQDGDLVLIDAGANFHGYAADITRTFPVNGKFSEAQASLYQLVLDAQLGAMEILVPGNNLKQATDVAVEIICQGLIERGILKGTLEENIKSNSWRTYFMHGLGHWLGLNVHDVGMYKIDGEDRPLLPGMVLTVEPGIYIDFDADVDPKWQGIGIRIEDNIVITESGHDVLTSAVPKTIAEIEALMSEK